MKNIVAVLLAFSLFCACKSDPNSFVIKGETSGLKDGTIVYLLHLQKNVVFDSAIIKKNKFVLGGFLEDSPTKMVLLTSRGDVSPHLWITTDEIEFIATSSPFNAGLIKGSSAQIVYDHFTAQIDSLSTPDAVLMAVNKTLCQYPDSKVSVSLLSEYYRDMPRTMADTLFHKLRDDIRSSDAGKRIAHYLEVNQNPVSGDPFIDFTMNDSSDQPVRLSDHLGKATLLHFWASWCDSCRYETKTLSTLHETYRSSGFQIFSVSLDFDKNDWVKAIRQDQLTWPQVCDLKGRDNNASLMYGVNRVPGNFLIDSNGIITARNLDIDSLSSLLHKVLSE